jgi:hypothetical protein
MLSLQLTEGVGWEVKGERCSTRDDLSFFRVRRGFIKKSAPLVWRIKIVLVLEKWGWGGRVLESCACCELMVLPGLPWAQL